MKFVAYLAASLIGPLHATSLPKTYSLAQVPAYQTPESSKSTDSSSTSTQGSSNYPPSGSSTGMNFNFMDYLTGSPVDKKQSCCKHSCGGSSCCPDSGCSSTCGRGDNSISMVNNSKNVHFCFSDPKCGACNDESIKCCCDQAERMMQHLEGNYTSKPPSGCTSSSTGSCCNSHPTCGSSLCSPNPCSSHVCSPHSCNSCNPCNSC
mmetsp:Transcript_17912/g.24069  ORF Transcript_17912/g.24069 Transcript_17912/m.24069 type:complete len:206 (+) Transcript_17912:43-660(+)